MTAAMRAWSMLLRQSALERPLFREVWISWGFLGVAALACLATFAGLLSRGPGAFVAAGFAAVVAIMWWGIYLQNAVRQNTPTLAALVPGLRRRLMTLTAVLWLVASLVPALLFGAVFGHFGYTLLLTAAVLLFIALCSRYVWLAFAPSIAIMLAMSVFGHSIMGTLAGPARLGQPVVTITGLLLLVPLGVWVLYRLFPRGGDGHYTWDQCTGRRRRNQQQGRAAIDDSTRSWQLLQQPFDLLYATRLAAGGARAGAEALLDGLGPRAHWSRTVLSLALATAGILILQVWLSADGRVPFGQHVVIVLMTFAVMHVKATATAMKERIGEQAVLRLTPAAPAVPLLNRELAQALLCRFAIAWGTYAVCAALVIVVLSNSAGGWAVWLLCVALAAATAPVLLRDYPAQPGWESSSLTLFGLLIGMQGVMAVVTRSDSAVVPVACIAVVVLLATSVRLRLRWQRMMPGAPAWPAGRLAA